MGFGENILKLSSRTKLTLDVLGEVFGLSTRVTSKRPEEREVVVDSGASMHMTSKTDLSSYELDTLRRSRNPTVVRTANGEVHTNEKAQVYVHDLNLFVTVQFLEETPAVVSLEKLSEDHGYSCVSGSAVKSHC